MERSTLLEEAIEAWTYTREGVLEELGVIPEAAWGFRPAPESRSVVELARHVIESGRLMTGELTREGGDFLRAPPVEVLTQHTADLPPATTPAEITALLSSTLEEGARALRDAGEVHMLQRIRRFDGELGTRLAWLHHGIAHEDYHRGQLALYARIQGIVPALTRRIMGG